MKYFSVLLFTLTAILSASFTLTATAQTGDEVIVTGSRISYSPGIIVEKKGDFLLLEVNVENDSRELSTRLKEMNATIEKMIEAARKDPDIILSLIDENDFVRPLTIDSFHLGIGGGKRPDTSVATLKVKTNIPARIEDSFKLAQKLAEFVDNVEEIGRTKVINFDEVSVSVVNPFQYRDEVRNKIITEINATTNALNGEYRVIINGLDGPVKWTRSGDLNLAFFMEYSYEIIPASLTSLQIDE